MLYGELPEVKLSDDRVVKGITIKNPNPPKVAVLGLPANAEMMKYLGAQRSLYRDLGRGKGESESVATPKADLALFLSMRLDAGDEFDEFEAANAIAKLTRTRVMNVERDGSDYRITQETVFGQVVHVLGSPSAKDLDAYRRNVYKARELPYNQEERRFPPEVPVRLYDAIVKEIEGYAPNIKSSDIPPHHKASAAVAVVQAIENIDPIADLDPNS